jgi:glycosyltransferase involved in cell wall biosynthesis
MKPLMLLSTLHGDHAARSGYQALAAHLPEARVLHAQRSDPPGGLPLLGARVARRLSFSRWYLGGCAALEVRAWGELRRGFSGIVHVMWADHDLGFLDLLLDRRRHRLVGSFHNCDDTFIHTIRFPGRLRRFDAIILMSRTQERFFLEAGVSPERIHVVRHGIDTQYFRPVDIGPIGPIGPMSPSGPIFTVLAAGGYRRNFSLLREVCLRLKDNPGIRFQIVAPPSQRSAFEDLPNAQFRTGLNDAEFLEAYQNSSCLLQTVENATANNVILEAMACGKPVVAENVGGIPEYVDDSCGILTAPGDAEGLARALADLNQNPAKRDCLAAGARKRAETLDWNNVASKMREIYETL